MKRNNIVGIGFVILNSDRPISRMNNRVSLFSVIRICLNEIVNEVKNAAPFKEVFMTRAGCTVSSHCGANTLGVLFIRNTPIE